MCALQNYAEGTTASTAKGEEEILVLALVDGTILAIRSNDLKLQNSINTQT